MYVSNVRENGLWQILDLGLVWIVGEFWFWVDRSLGRVYEGKKQWSLLSQPVSQAMSLGARCTDRMKPRLSCTDAYAVVLWPGSWPLLVNVKWRINPELGYVNNMDKTLNCVLCQWMRLCQWASWLSLPCLGNKSLRRNTTQPDRWKSRNKRS